MRVRLSIVAASFLCVVLMIAFGIYQERRHCTLVVASKDLPRGTIIEEGFVEMTDSDQLFSDTNKDTYSNIEDVIGSRLHYGLNRGNFVSSEALGHRLDKKSLRMKYKVVASEDIRKGQILNAKLFEVLKDDFNGFGSFCVKSMTGTKAPHFLKKGDPIDIQFVSNEEPLFVKSTGDNN